MVNSIVNEGGGGYIKHKSVFCVERAEYRICMKYAHLNAMQCFECEGVYSIINADASDGHVAHSCVALRTDPLINEIKVGLLHSGLAHVHGELWVNQRLLLPVEN